MDGVPFELLDPCCQKDVLERRRNQELKARLATTDPSLKKERLIESVFNGSNRYQPCHACCAAVDYPLLAEIRTQAQADNRKGDAAGDANSAHENESDEDSDLDFDDGFESEYAKEMKIRLLERSQLLQEKQKVGLGLHVDDSEEHVLRYIEMGARLILHIYDPNSVISAKLDLSLEAAAKRFTSTRFRRLAIFAGIDGICPNYGLPLHTPLLACFAEKHVATFTTNLTDLVPDGEINSINFLRFIENSKVAVDGDDSDYNQLMSISDVLASAHAENRKSDSDAEEAINLYCDEPGCTKLYGHTHISSGAGKSKGGGLFFGDAAGSEALGKDYFGRL